MTSSYLRAPFPWVTKCQIEGQENSLMLPIKLNSTRYIGDADHPRAGPGDPRDKRAVFLGSDTGELLGRCAQTGRGAQGVQGYKLRVGLECSPPPAALELLITPGLATRHAGQACSLSVLKVRAGAGQGRHANLRPAQAADLTSLTSPNSLLGLQSRAEGQVPAGYNSLATGTPRPLAHQHAADSCCFFAAAPELWPDPALLLRAAAAGVRPCHDFPGGACSFIVLGEGVHWLGQQQVVCCKDLPPHCHPCCRQLGSGVHVRHKAGAPYPWHWACAVGGVLW